MSKRQKQVGGGMAEAFVDALRDVMQEDAENAISAVLTAVDEQNEELLLDASVSFYAGDYGYSLISQRNIFPIHYPFHKRGETGLANLVYRLGEHLHCSGEWVEEQVEAIMNYECPNCDAA